MGLPFDKLRVGLPMHDRDALWRWMSNVQRFLDSFSPSPPLFGTEGQVWTPFAQQLIVQDDRYCTNLTEDFVLDASTLAVESTAIFPSGEFVILIDNEYMLVSVTDETSLDVSEAGYYSSGPSNHSAGAQVSQQVSINTTLVDDASAGDTSVTVADGTMFPNTLPFMVMLDPGESEQEYVVVVAVAFNVLVGINIGDSITGPGIPGGTTVAGFQDLTVTLSQPATETADGTTFTVGAVTFTGSTADGDDALYVTGSTQAQWTLQQPLANDHDVAAVATQVLPDVVQAVTQLMFEGNAFVQPGPQIGQVIHREVCQVIFYDSFTLNENGFYPGHIEVWDDSTGTLVETVPIQIIPNE